MKALANKIDSFVLFGFTGVLLLLLASCAPVRPDNPHADNQPDPSAFADALSPPGGVPCRLGRPKYTALQRQMGVRGSVRITYVVNTAGRIDLVIVDKSSGNQELDSAAREAIANGTCAPYVVDGVAHRVVQHTTFNFEPAVHALPPGRSDAAAAINPSSAAAALYRSQQASVIPVMPAQAVPSVSTASPPLPASSTGSLSLVEAIQAASLQKLGIAPDSLKAATIKRWSERMRTDPDVSRFLGNGPNHASLLALSPLLRTEFFTEGMLRLSPEERSKLAELASKAFDNAPPDCGGIKSVPLVMSRYMSIATMSDADVDAYFGVTFAMLKQSALQTPLAQVTQEQRAQGQSALVHSLQDLLKNDAQGTRDVAAAVVDPTGVTAEVWCRNARVYNRALLAMPQPLRDWSIVAASIDAKTRLASMAQPFMPGAGSPGAAPGGDYATQVQRRIRPNIVWAGPTLDLETVISVRCAPTGTLLSAAISRSSGNATWDMAALRAIQRSDPMPLDTDGRAPPAFSITLRPAGG
jgi:TonB family protein